MDTARCLYQNFENNKYVHESVALIYCLDTYYYCQSGIYLGRDEAIITFILNSITDLQRLDPDSRLSVLQIEGEERVWGLCSS